MPLAPQRDLCEFFVAQRPSVRRGFVRRLDVDQVAGGIIDDGPSALVSENADGDAQARMIPIANILSAAVKAAARRLVVATFTMTNPQHRSAQ
jgi:hypothetical protein